MTIVMSESSRCRRRLSLRWRFPHHRMSFRTLHHCPLRPARRFSASLGCARRCSYLCNNPPHRPPHLTRACLPHARLPRPPFRLHPWRCQHQFVMHDCHHIAPALHLRRRPHPHVGPHQILFIEAIAVFLPIAARIQPGQFRHLGQYPAHPPKPRFARVTLGPLC
jgi:hypothetical protein